VRLHGPDGPDEAIDDNIVSVFDRPPLEQFGDGTGGLLRDISVEAGDATRA
jgi:hypothetical protein